MPKFIGARIREARQKKGWSAHKLAEVYGVTDGAVAAWEVGLPDEPVYDLSKLSQILGVTEQWLRTGEG